MGDDEKAISPRNYLRARRPEKFSDSVQIERSVLDRASLEYHLASLTSRSEEINFEDFARQLSQRVIAPNLTPHTGPTGGGDSKVDSETYPVAGKLTAAWYVGSGGSSGDERWAFAISAKREWKPKAISDISAIAGTDRGYKKAFFISNQAIPDRQRAAVEDQLRKKHGLDVRIYDRNWILDRVFEGHHERLAIEALDVRTSQIHEIEKGPRDAQREKDLRETEARIESQVQRSIGPPFVDDCLTAALLARSLERPRVEVEGRFVRLRDAAENYGTLHQRVLAFYQHAWTAFWWFEDYPLVLRLYGEVARLALDSPKAADLELLTNLWTLASAMLRHRHATPEAVSIDAKAAELVSALDRLGEDNTRPSVALSARADRARVKLLSNIADPDDAFRDLKAIVEQSAGLIGYPLERLSDGITELSNLFVSNPAFEELFEALVSTMADRKGDLAAATLLLQRGAGQLDAERPYEAIRSIGRALRRLYKYESRHAMVRALVLCAAAYERVGLMWAARGTLLHAASIATNEWWTHSEITTAQLRCYNRLKWVELQLGRVPHLLAWHELDRAASAIVRAGAQSDSEQSAVEVQFDVMVGLLMLRLDLWQLREVERLPAALEKLELGVSAVALEFALGYLDDIPSNIGADPEAVGQFMKRLASQPAASDLSQPLLGSSPKVHLFSTVLGCRIEAIAESSSPCTEVSESILACVESLLSTSVLQGISPRVPRLNVIVRRSTTAERPFEFEFGEEFGLPVLEVRCADFKPDGMTQDEQTRLKQRMSDVVTGVLLRVFMIESVQEIDRVFGDEKGLDRAVDFTSSFGPIANTLGRESKTRIENWCVPSAPRRQLRRSEEWDAVDRRNDTRSVQATPREDLKPGDGDMPHELDPSKLKHTDLHFESVIRQALWEKAHWRGIGYATEGGPLPWMVLVFEHEESAAQLMSALVQDLGQGDPQDKLRVAIVRGIDRISPQNYRALIGSNPAFSESTKISLMMTQVHEMRPQSDQNLSGFLAAYALVGRYYLGVGAAPKGQPMAFRILPVGAILKRKLFVRHAWEIGPNDPDSIGVDESDDVKIPAEHASDAPVLRLSEWRKKLHTPGRRAGIRDRSKKAAREV